MSPSTPATHSPGFGHQGPALSRCWLLAWLTLAAALAGWGAATDQALPSPARIVPVAAATTPVAGPPTARSATHPIEAIRLGDRLAGRNPLRDQVEPVEPDPATWRSIRLRMEKPGGLALRVELLRPREWIEATGAAPGRTIELDLAEMGAVGAATVTEVGPCPSIRPGTGAVVTGKFAHECDGSNVIELRLEGEEGTTGVTRNHLYWSEDRRAFVAAGELRVGEAVDTAAAGPRRVASVLPSSYRGLLYNLETTEHVYRVGTLGTLVHNLCPRVLGETMRDRVIPVAEAIGARVFKPRGPNPLRGEGTGTFLDLDAI